MQILEGIVSLVSEILFSLGVDHTLFYHLGIFLVVYLVLSQIIFKPYFAAYLKRRERTVGNQDKAENLLAEAKQLEASFASKAREINEKIKAVYDKEKAQALKRQEEIVALARQQVKEGVEANRQIISQEVQKAKQDLSEQAPSVSQAIVNQLLGKELKA